MIITNPDEVRNIYRNAAEKKWVLPCFCTENLTTTEAILSAADKFAKTHNLEKLPVVIAITCTYSHRAQAENYTHTRDYKTGMKLFQSDVKALADKGCYFDNLDVMLHLDHIQYNEYELLESDLSGYSSIMYDASELLLDENIKLTADFVRKNKDIIVIEGACDQIVDATGSVHNELTTPENALRYANETGVDFIVANLGTEHRATGKELKYYEDRAREIKAKIGAKIVLHGTSSVTNSQVVNLFNDGVCKVNIWTALERDATPKLFEDMVKSGAEIVNSETIERLIEEGYLTEKCLTGQKPSIAKYTTMYRQDIIFKEMEKMVTEYLDMWYIV